MFLGHLYLKYQRYAGVLDPFTTATFTWMRMPIFRRPCTHKCLCSELDLFSHILYQMTALCLWPSLNLTCTFQSLRAKLNEDNLMTWDILFRFLINQTENLKTVYSVLLNYLVIYWFIILFIWLLMSFSVVSNITFQEIRHEWCMIRTFLFTWE